MFDKKVFVSHSSKNKEIADHLCAFIARLGVKEKNIFCSSVVGQGIGNGEKLNTAIANAIQDSSLLIFLLSYDFISSPYCMEELGVGWYLSQRGDVSCYYLVLPDIEMYDLIGFVNSKIDKFTFLDNNHHEEISSLSCDLSKQLRFRMKSHNIITNAENVFLSSIKSSNEQLIEAKNTRKHQLELEENEKNELKKVIEDDRKAINALNELLLQVKQRQKQQDASVELQAIERIFCSLSYTDLVPKKALDSLEKDFWFEFINRYDELLTQLNLSPSVARMERVISFVFLAINNPETAYTHFLNYVKLEGKSITEYDLDYFAKEYNGTMKEIISMLEDFHAPEREGLLKDELESAIEFLKTREELYFG